MRLISTKYLLAAIEPYPDAEAPIKSWRKLIKDNNWDSLEEIREGYSRSVDEVYGYTIFNIKGNTYRLIVQINYRTKIIFFKQFLTHAEYDKINWADKDAVRRRMTFNRR
jgi:mRNA interferase HigB